MHNQEYLCDLEGIHVGGSDATSARQTSCDSFEERREDHHSNRWGTASDISQINCQATDCKYNEDYDCHAGKISVEGGNAHQAESTECATFEHE